MAKAVKNNTSEEKVTWVVAKESNGNVQITFTIPFSTVKKAQDDTLVEFAKDIEIPGFRKGKAPIEKVKEKVSQNQLIEHSLSHILPEALANAISAEKLNIALYPKFELIKASENEAWQIKAITCELPGVDLGDYKKAIEGALRASSLVIPGKEPSTTDSAQKKEETVIKTLLETVKIDIPQILIQEEADSRISSLLSRLEKLGLSLESYLTSTGKKAEDLKADYANQAREAISLDLILSKVAETEGIKVSEAEVETALGVSEATKSSTNVEDLDQRKRLLTSILRRRQALDFLMKLA